MQILLPSSSSFATIFSARRTFFKTFRVSWDEPLRKTPLGERRTSKYPRPVCFSHRRHCHFPSTQVFQLVSWTASCLLACPCTCLTEIKYVCATLDSLEGNIVSTETNTQFLLHGFTTHEVVVHPLWEYLKPFCTTYNPNTHQEEIRKQRLFSRLRTAFAYYASVLLPVGPECSSDGG